MANATIFYYKEMGYHQDDAELESFWKHISYDDNLTSVPLSRRLFKKNWVRLPFKESASPKALDVLFAKYNTGANPLGNTLNPGQTILHSLRLKHTSMSIGDIIKVGSTYYVCAGSGWVKIKFISSKPEKITLKMSMIEEDYDEEGRNRRSKERAEFWETH